VTQGQSDGRNPKFRILCKRCNSYRHTVVTFPVNRDARLEPSDGGYTITCRRCLNTANDFNEETEGNSHD
jgi:ribosomal protein L37E